MYVADGMIPSLNGGSSVFQITPQPATAQIRWKKVRRPASSTRLYTRKQKNNLILPKNPNFDHKMAEVEEYFHKAPSLRQNNQDSSNLSRSTTVPDFVQSHPMGRNPVPIELARQSAINEISQFAIQKRNHELLQPQNTPIMDMINEPMQPKNTPTEIKEDEQNEEFLKDFFKTELDKFFSFEGGATGETEDQEVSSSTKLETQQTETCASMDEDSSSTVLFKKKNKSEITLDLIFSKYENNSDLGEFVDSLEEVLPLNLFREKNVYITKALQILETDDVTGEYSEQFLKSFLNKRYLSKYNPNGVNVFIRIVKSMGLRSLVKAYNLYPPIILEPVNGTDIITALKSLKFSGKRRKLEFLEAHYREAIKNSSQGNLPEKAID